MSSGAHRALEVCNAQLAFAGGNQSSSAIFGIDGLKGAQSRVAGIAQGGAQKQAHDQNDQNDQNGEVNVMRHGYCPSPAP
ncbi:hypothetical protein N8D55_12310 [Xanthomonas hortorum pv. pelargonii]|nr:hypothetical protein N8D55_12310 [Xanthomonas hortorum pv. pelargonii]